MTADESIGERLARQAERVSKLLNRLVELVRRKGMEPVLDKLEDAVEALERDPDREAPPDEGSGSGAGGG